MRMPPRAFGSRYGAFVMLSMPPATITSAEPASSMSCANIAARMPEPHILLIVVQPVDERQARAERRLTRGRLALSRRQHAAHDGFVDLLGFHARALDRRPDRGGAELRRGQRREIALKRGHRRARRRDDDDRIVCVSLMFQLLDDALNDVGNIAQTRRIGREYIVLRGMRAAASSSRQCTTDTPNRSRPMR